LVTLASSRSIYLSEEPRGTIYPDNLHGLLAPLLTVALGTEIMSRTKVIQQQTKNLRAARMLLGHRSLESTIRYLGVEFDDALELSEHAEI